MNYRFIPIHLKQANEFVESHHRHNKKTWGHKFSIGLECDGRLVGVGIAGRPIARLLDNGTTLEITRVCVAPGYKNACSKIYARLKKIGKLFGYTSIKTYTLASEPGSSLTAIGAVAEQRVLPHKGWDRPGKPSVYQAVYAEEKRRWELLR